jgi:uncharacterized protein HemY
MTFAFTFIAVLARWLVVVLGVLAWLVVVPFIALASELAEWRRMRRTRRVAAALPPRGALQEL